MKFCIPHHIQFQTAAKDRNLTIDLTADARNAITFNTAQIFGDEVYIKDICPLCELKKYGVCDPGEWIAGSCDDQVEVGKQCNLIPS